ncbi:class I lanthipeptide [Chitinophaga nivalis]|uniref:Class I lanthipeptide n=1 Tax=Chitinophaga nivalis TaxID=2991709 RepID=A0ABT3IJG2_9BACT|nr:class I lanthipeptide [Chitinophaga nivalis]MCW3466212.1 class I lanthipeptide [Chitinophaga nivalis]MCW3484097.1 class I lanthipeptide [Chitinophaga nivalis]
MKKKQLSLSKKLLLKKEAILELNKNQQNSLAGGAAASRIDCGTWDPERTCETHPRPGHQCV